MRLRCIIAKNVKKYREKAGMTKIELSKKLGKSNDFIERLEDNKLSKSLTIVLVEEIAIILNVSVQDMMIDE